MGVPARSPETRTPQPPMQSSPPTTPQPPQDHAQARHQFASLLHSLERRSHSRAQSLSVLPLASPASSDPAWRRQKAHSLSDPDLTLAFLHELENDLALAAEVGQALLKEKNELDSKVAGLEGANGGLLGRLTTAVKETSQLQRVRSHRDSLWAVGDAEC